MAYITLLLLLVELMETYDRVLKNEVFSSLFLSCTLRGLVFLHKALSYYFGERRRKLLFTVLIEH